MDAFYGGKDGLAWYFNVAKVVGTKVIPLDISLIDTQL
jgi:hypothetical protein